MTGILIRVIVVVVVVAVIYQGLRSIWRDWTSHFREEDQARKARDQREARRPDVVELERDQDGVYRPRPKDE
jgi:hypothetical protein